MVLLQIIAFIQSILFILKDSITSSFFYLVKLLRFNTCIWDGFRVPFKKTYGVFSSKVLFKKVTRDQLQSLCLIPIILILLLLLVGGVQGATHYICQAPESCTYQCDGSDVDCTNNYKWALANASSGDVIQFNDTGSDTVYHLNSSRDFPIDKSLTIRGESKKVILTYTNNTDWSGMFYINNNSAEITIHTFKANTTDLFSNNVFIFPDGGIKSLHVYDWEDIATTDIKYDVYVVDNTNSGDIDNISIHDCEFAKHVKIRYVNGSGVTGDGIYNNKIGNNSINGGSNSVSSLELDTHVTYFSVWNNTIRRIANYAIGGGKHHIKIENNTLYGDFNSDHITHLHFKNNIIKPGEGFSNAGIRLHFYQGSIENNLIENNIIRTGQSYPCILLDNTTHAVNPSWSEVDNNTFRNNVLFNCSNGVEFEYLCNANFSNNIIVNNSEDGFRNIYGNTNISSSYNDLWGNDGQNYNGTVADKTGDISQNPLFNSSTSPYDFHLKSTEGRYYQGSWVTDSEHSPCIDAGDPNSSVGEEESPNGSRINIGRYGGTSEASKTAYFNFTGTYLGLDVINRINTTGIIDYGTTEPTSYTNISANSTLGIVEATVNQWNATTGEGNITLTTITTTIMVHPGESIQEAIDNLPAEGGIVELTEGVHYLNDSINITNRSDISVRGGGVTKEDTEIKYDGYHPDFNTFNITNSTNITIENMYIYSTDTGFISDDVGDGIYIAGASHYVTISNITVERLVILIESFR